MQQGRHLTGDDSGVLALRRSLSIGLHGAPIVVQEAGADEQIGIKRVFLVHIRGARAQIQGCRNGKPQVLLPQGRTGTQRNACEVEVPVRHDDMQGLGRCQRCTSDRVCFIWFNGFYIWGLNIQAGKCCFLQEKRALSPLRGGAQKGVHPHIPAGLGGQLVQAGGPNPSTTWAVPQDIPHRSVMRVLPVLRRLGRKNGETAPPLAVVADGGMPQAALEALGRHVPAAEDLDRPVPVVRGDHQLAPLQHHQPVPHVPMDSAPVPHRLPDGAGELRAEVLFPQLQPAPYGKTHLRLGDRRCRRGQRHGKKKGRKEKTGKTLGICHTKHLFPYKI